MQSKVDEWINGNIEQMLQGIRANDPQGNIEEKLAKMAASQK